MKELLRNGLWGAIMALGELLPGVGMQTVAIIAGLYDDVIAFLFQGTEFVKTLGLFILAKAKKEEVSAAFFNIPWKFGLSVFGILFLTIIAFSHAVGAVFEVYPTQISALSFGIIMASILIPYKEITEKTWKEYLLFAVSFLCFFGLFSIQGSGTSAPPSALTFFGGGLVASLAAFFPGISISLALLLMGLYEPLFGSIEQLTSRQADSYSFLTVLLFLVGLAIGMLLCVRILNYVLQKYKSLFLAFIVGLILASLRGVWPFIDQATQQAILPWNVPVSQLTQQILLITVAFIVVSLVRKYAENKGTLASSFGQKERIVIT